MWDRTKAHLNKEYCKEAKQQNSKTAKQHTACQQTRETIACDDAPSNMSLQQTKGLLGDKNITLKRHSSTFILVALYYYSQSHCVFSCLKLVVICVCYNQPLHQQACCTTSSLRAEIVKFTWTIKEQCLCMMRASYTPWAAGYMCDFFASRFCIKLIQLLQPQEPMNNVAFVFLRVYENDIYMNSSLEESSAWGAGLPILLAEAGF